MVVHEKLKWHQTSPGLWQRGIDEVEEFYATMAALYEGSGRMFFAITGHVSIEVDVPSHMSVDESEKRLDAALSKAWICMRYDHPTIASRVSLHSKTHEWIKSYRKILAASDLEDWLRRTFIVLSNGQSGAEFANSDPPAPKDPTCFVLRQPSARGEAGNFIIRRDIVLRSPHDIIDGIGTLMLFSNFIARSSEAYSKGDSYPIPLLDGSENANLSPSYRIAAFVPSVLTEAQERRIERIIAQRAAVKSDATVEILTVPFQHGALVPGRHQRSALTLSRDQTSSFLAACKVNGVTPTHVFHAAAAVALRDLQPRPEVTKRVRYISYILRNERSRCAEPFNSTRHPVALYHSVSGNSLVVDLDLRKAGDEPSDQDRKQEFYSVLKTIKAFYEGVRNDSDHYALVPKLWALSTPPLPVPSSHSFPVPLPNAHPSVSISSMGRSDTILTPKMGAFRVSNPWVTGEELGTGWGLFLSTFDGELCLSAAYNDAWHTRETVDDYLKRCRDIAFTCLGL
ncbi:uncharacterized protein CTHT_0035680 [Thermochaetoides thermophila DSM 1495]|uniref:Uncharacterized protein n=1 Tax=Chaetomium thermophilum (strain DSM 1495 / CBS 144.50 / IMI 039719) TaxID=759272 RepID=G0S704_CHATD|nr:hypothetical protein CTHT_0035680 [Thermochaetoides thermophila DSM 1495]EGS21702.1 hypothetical protein CTHT_0035680 [Thermochaetoides thermophila DSM 1495]